MPKNNQLGYSLLESLIALAIISTLCLMLMQLQLRLLAHTQHVAYQQSAIYAQISLAERIKSCLSHQGCEKTEIERFKNTLNTLSPTLECELTQKGNTFINTLYWKNKQENIQLEFDHAS